MALDSAPAGGEPPRSCHYLPVPAAFDESQRAFA
jgi:hypothetical protein